MRRLHTLLRDVVSSIDVAIQFIKHGFKYRREVEALVRVLTAFKDSIGSDVSYRELVKLYEKVSFYHYVMSKAEKYLNDIIRYPLSLTLSYTLLNIIVTYVWLPFKDNLPLLVVIAIATVLAVTVALVYLLLLLDKYLRKFFFVDELDELMRCLDFALENIALRRRVLQSRGRSRRVSRCGKP